jgi:gamma-glutamyl-gamma-aminobutyrate hydrolase PuuD
MSLKAGLTCRYPHKAEPYAEALRQAGIEPVLISADKPRELAGLQGLVLSGGTDLNPARYGGTPHPANEAPDDPRDELETGLLAEALAADLPVLAICRGLQLFNVAHGGTLIQHLENSAAHVVRGNDPALPAHDILVEPGTRLAAILGEGAHAVNSRHHQAVERVGAGLRVTARSTPDGIIEALERSDGRFALAVQWHPEDQARRDAEQRKLFEAFAAALPAPPRAWFGV